MKSLTTPLLIAAATTLCAAISANADVYINLGSNNANSSGAGEISYADGWNNATNASSSATAATTVLTDTAGNATTFTVTWASNNTYMWTDSTDEVLKGYLDDGGDHAKVTVSNISYELYDVVVIAATDTNNYKFSPVTINETQYTSNGDGAAVAGTDAWGRTHALTVLPGVNSMVLSGVSGANLAIVGGGNVESTSRGGIAGVQIIDQTGKIWNRTITADTTWRGDNWTYSGTGIADTAWDSITATGLTADLSGTGTVTLDAAVSLDRLRITSGAITLAGSGLTGLSTIQVSSGATLNVGVVVTPSSALTLTNAGTLNFTAAQDFGANSVELVAGTTSFNGLTTTGALSIAGGTNTFNTALSVGSFSITGGANTFNVNASLGNITTSSATTITGTGAITIGDIVLNADAKLGGTGAQTISSITTNAGTLTIASGSTVSITGGYSASNTGSTGHLVMEANSTLSVAGTLSSAWGTNITLGANSVLNTAELRFTPGGTERTISGDSSATINATKLSIGNVGNYQINDVRLNIGSGGMEKTDDNGYTLKFGDATVGASADWTSALAMTLNDTATGTTFDTNGHTIGLSGAISGTGKLVVDGAGTLTLSGGYSASDVTVNSGATLELNGGIIASGTSIANSGTVTVGGSVVFDLAGTTATTIITGGTITGWDSLTDSSFTIGGNALSGRQTVDLTTAGVVSISGVAANITWNSSSAGGAWDTTSTNWLNGTTPDKFFASDNVTFGATGAGTITVDSAGMTAGTMAITEGGYTFTGGNMTATSIAVSANGDTTFANNVSTGTLTKSGSGTLLISSSTFSGAVTIDAGTVKIGNANGTEHNEITLTSVTVNGGTFDVNGTKDTTFGITLAAGGSLVNNGNDVDSGKRQTPSLTLTGDATVGGTNRFGVIGAGYGATTVTLNDHTLTKTGDNAWMLVNTTVSSGTIKIDAGSVELRTNGNSSAATFDIGSAGTLSVINNNDNIGSIKGSGTVDVASDVTAIVVRGLTGGTITKTGDGTLKFSSTEYSVSGANLVINGGVVDLAAGGQDGALRGAITVNSGAELKLSVNDSTGWGANHVSSLNINGGTLNITTTGGSGQNQTFNNLGITLDGGTITGAEGSSFDLFGGTSSITTVASATTSTISNGLVCIRQSEGATFTVADGEADIDLLISAKISNTNSASNYGSNKLVKAGAGKMVLTGSNDWTGATEINGGTLQVGNNGTTGRIGSGSVSVASGATLKFAHATGTNYGLSSVVSGAGSLEAAGTNLTLSGANTYTGGTTISAGKVIANNASALGTGAVTLTGGTLELSSNLSIGSLSGTAGTIDLKASTLTVNQTVNGTYAGTITNDDGTLIKTGAADLTLTSANTYTYTQVNEGKLIIQNNQALGSGAVTIANGATLVVNTTGTVANDITIASGGTLEVDSTGTVTLSGLVSGAVTITNATELIINNADSEITVADTNGAKISVENGTLKLSGSLPITSQIVIASGSTFDANTAITMNENIVLQISDADLVSGGGTGMLKGTQSNVTFGTGFGFVIDTSNLTGTYSDEEIFQLVVSGFETNWGFTADTLKVGQLLSDGTFVEGDWSFVGYDTTNGKLTLSSVPEPSLFGSIAGLIALALVGTRRRRNTKKA